MSNTEPTPILFIPHGGGPLPLLGEPGHAALSDFLASVTEHITTPRAIVMISAHWEETRPTVSTAAMPGMIFDYYGFPDAAYKLNYPAPGDGTLATRIVTLLTAHGIAATSDAERGYDHGTFVPLMLMYPQATIPVVQLSLVASLDAAAQMDMGRAIAELSRDGVLIVGSGMSFHNMDAFRSAGPDLAARSATFDTWLNTVVIEQADAPDSQRKALVDWVQAPEARYCHPREEHLLPLHVCAGAAAELGLTAHNVFNDSVLGARVSAFLWR